MEAVIEKYSKSRDPVYRSLIMKAYYEANKEKHKARCREQAKQRYYNDPEHRLAKIEKCKKRVMEKKTERVMCDICGYDVMKAYYAKHLRTKTHAKNLEKKNKTEEENNEIKVSSMTIHEEAE